MGACVEFTIATAAFVRHDYCENVRALAIKNKKCSRLTQACRKLVSVSELAGGVISSAFPRLISLSLSYCSRKFIGRKELAKLKQNISPFSSLPQ